MKENYILFLLSILVFSCSSGDEDNLPIVLEPTVNTLSAIVGENGGVILSGSFTHNDFNISAIGFEYALDSLFNNDKIVLNSENNANSEINFFITTGIEENVKYYYRAFVLTGSDYFFGNVKDFISDGSVIPIIDSLTNDYGHFDDTLGIYGRYFTDDNYQTYVDFSNTNTQIISINDTLIKCIVPTNINIINNIGVKIDNRAGIYSSYTLYAPTIESIEPISPVIGDTITINGTHYDLVNSRNKILFGNKQAPVIESHRQYIKTIVPIDILNSSESIVVNSQLQDVIYNNFKLATPEIISITPINATFRDELTITGNNFDYDISRNRVFFGNIEARITYADKNTLKVIVPDDIENSSEQIKVIAQLQEVVYNEVFKLIPPKISLVPHDVYANQNILIQGEYFHPINDRNTITIENIEVNITSGDTQNLNSNIPLGPFPRRKAIVKVQVLDVVVEYEIELNILDKWIMVSNNLPFSFFSSISNAIVVNNEAYVIAPSTDNNDENFYLWKFNNQDFSWEQNSIPFSLKWSGVASTNGDNIFVYTAESDNAYWQYDPFSQQWTKLTAYPGARRDSPTHFTINDDIYIGLGADFEPYTSIQYGDFYKYSTNTDTWAQIADFTFRNYSVRIETSTFTINNIAYVGGGATNTGMFDYWSYHPNTDEWIRIADFNDARRQTASFVLNGFGYITGGGKVGGGNRSDCWQYEPSTNIWTQIEDVGHIPRSGHFSFSLNGKAYIGGGRIYSGGSGGVDFYEFIP